jgi:hypothetical protein
MTRSILSGLLGLLSVIAVGSLPTACESGGVGDPCLPEDEYNPLFAGFKVTEENIESRSFQCQTRICLVNHFQGRVSCPLGQSEPKSCNPEEQGSCPETGTVCRQAAVSAPDCTFGAAEGNPTNCKCQPGGFCGCDTTADCPLDGKWYCDAKDKQCKTYVCLKEGNDVCQSSDATDNAGKACCIPGTTTPVTTSVCGQCSDDSTRSRDQAVYCSCRCGVADGEKEDPNFNFCECPTGYTCDEIRKNVGLGDEQITGKYCIKQGSKFVNESDCKSVLPGSYYNSTECKGTAPVAAPSAQ